MISFGFVEGEMSGALAMNKIFFPRKNGRVEFDSNIFDPNAASFDEGRLHFSCCLGLRNLETNVLTFSPRNNLPDIRNLSRQQTKRVKFFENIPRVWRGIIVLVEMTQPETRLMVFSFLK